MTLRFAAGEQLAQVRPGGTSAVELYTAPADPSGKSLGGVTVEVTRILVCNQDSSARTFQLCHDNSEGGTTHDGTTALFWSVSVPANSTTEIISEAPGSGLMIRSGYGRLSVQASVADLLTFTAYGVVGDTNPR